MKSRRLYSVPDKAGGRHDDQSFGWSNITRMGLLSIIERELRTSARNRKTHLFRLAMAIVALLMLAWMIWLFGGRKLTGLEIFVVFAWFGFAYCLLAGATWTADCLSEEKREGTLGLLFLTDLSGWQIVIGKLLASSLQSFYGLLAVLPVLALPLIMGGVQFGEFCRIALNWAATLGLSLAVGMFCSAISYGHRQAIMRAHCLLLLIGFGFPLISLWLRISLQPPALVRAFQVLSPFSAQQMAFASGIGLPSNHFLQSQLAVLAMTLGFLGMASWILPRVWQDRRDNGKIARPRRRWSRFQIIGQGLRRRMLEKNPIYWLAGREHLGTISFLILALLVSGIAGWVAGPAATRTFGGQFQPFEGQLFAWILAGLLLHSILLLRLSSISCHRLAEDRQSGALELLLATPLTEIKILRGLWRAFFHHLIPSAWAVLTIHLLCLCGVLALWDFMAGGLGGVWKTFQIVAGHHWSGAAVATGLPKEAPVVLLFIFALALQLLGTWVTLGWVGMWLALRVKKPRNAPRLTMALVLIPPWLIFSIVLKINFYFGFNQDELSLLNFCLMLGLVIGMPYNFLLSLWARRKLKREFRAAAQRFQVAEVPRPRETIRRTVRWWWAAGLAIPMLMVLFYTFENWRGERAWNRYKRELESKGEQFDLPSPTQPFISNDQNFAMTPFLAPLLDYRRGLSGIFWTDAIGYDRTQSFLKQFPAEPSGNWAAGERINLRKWLTASRKLAVKSQNQTNLTSLAELPEADLAGVVLADLEASAPIFEELREASRRPHSRFGIHLEEGFSALLPHMAVMSRVCQLLEIRALANLAIGQPEASVRDLQLIFDLADKFQTEPGLFSASMRARCVNFGMQVVWEGLASRKWSASQLQALEARLRSFDFLKGFRHAILTDRAWLCSVLEQVRTTRDLGQLEDWRKLNPLCELIPRGWFYQEQLNHVRLVQEQILPIFDLEAKRVNLKRSAEASKFLAEHLDHRFPLRLFLGHRAFAALVIPQGPRNDGFAWQSALSQVSVDQAIVACALERHRLARGRFPDQLAALVPEFLERLPHDLVTGAAFIYRPMEDGQFILYSVGWNGRDDGGKVVLPKRSEQRRLEGDWVWQYPRASGSDETGAFPDKQRGNN
jgi:hypothetical protein